MWSCLLGLACGGGDGAALASVSLSLSEELAARIESLQVTLVPSSASFDCARARAGCLVEQPVTPQPLAGEHEGQQALRVPWTSSQGAALMSLQVAAGGYLVHVEGLDAEGTLVANGCRLKVDLREGATTTAEVALGAYAGRACVGVR